MTYRLQAIDTDGRTRQIPRESTYEPIQEWRNPGVLVVMDNWTRTPGVSLMWAFVLLAAALKHPAPGVVEYRIVDEAGKVIERQEIGGRMAA